MDCDWLLVFRLISQYHERRAEAQSGATLCYIIIISYTFTSECLLKSLLPHTNGGLTAGYGILTTKTPCLCFHTSIATVSLVVSSRLTIRCGFQVLQGLFHKHLAAAEDCCVQWTRPPYSLSSSLGAATRSQPEVGSFLNRVYDEICLYTFDHSCKDTEGDGCGGHHFSRFIMKTKPLWALPTCSYHVPADVYQWCGYSFWDSFSWFDEGLCQLVCVNGEEAEKGWWWNDGRILSVFSSPSSVVSF